MYPCQDGYVAIILVREEQWRNLLRAMGREDLRDDPRFATNPDRVAHFKETEDVVLAWTQAHTRQEIFAATSKYKVPCAPVRDIEEVMNDPHMHQRGMLEWVDHYEYGNVVLPNSPLRFHGADQVPTTQNPKVGEHNEAVYGELLGLTSGDLARLRDVGAI